MTWMNIEQRQVSNIGQKKYKFKVNIYGSNINDKI